jgi:hypothetical protein
MLTNIDIERICKKLELPIVGVYSKDQLYNIPRQVGSYYINMEDSDKGNGSHWVMAKIYCDDDRDDDDDENTGHKICHALYFDSFGFGMPKAVADFLKPFKPVYCNNREIQDVKTDDCGWYCICCDYALEHHQNSKTYLADYEKFLNMWSSNPKKNLSILKSYFQRHTPYKSLNI